LPGYREIPASFNNQEVMSMGVPASRCIKASGCTLGFLSLLSGCAQTQLGAQYADPQFPPQTLQSATVLVVCDAPEPAIKLICESQISGQLIQLGARPLTDATLVNPTPGFEPSPTQYLPAAKAAGASAVFSTTLAPDYRQASPFSSFSIGIGGWGGSGGYHGGSGVGGGVGVTMPVGALQGSTGLAAIGSVVDVASSRVMWSAKVSVPPASDVTSQIAEAAKALAGAVRQAGLF
jgi:hypothetical protein